MCVYIHIYAPKAMHCVPDAERALGEIHRSMRPGARLPVKDERACNTMLLISEFILVIIIVKRIKNNANEHIKQTHCGTKNHERRGSSQKMSATVYLGVETSVRKHAPRLHRVV